MSIQSFKLAYYTIVYYILLFCYLKIHYLFGGNPGRADAQCLRLDDFWELRVYRCTSKELSSQCKLLIRKFK